MVSGLLATLLAKRWEGSPAAASSSSSSTSSVEKAAYVHEEDVENAPQGRTPNGDEENDVKSADSSQWIEMQNRGEPSSSFSEDSDDSEEEESRDDVRLLEVHIERPSAVCK